MQHIHTTSNGSRGIDLYDAPASSPSPPPLSPLTQVAEHLTLPLLAMVQELSRQQEEMAKLLRRKDKEIDDYKVLYGPPTRR